MSTLAPARPAGTTPSGSGWRRARRLSWFSLGDALLGAWWLDPVVGLLIAGVAVREGFDAWRGEGCCVGDPPAEVAPADECCQDRRCAGSSRGGASA